MAGRSLTLVSKITQWQSLVITWLLTTQSVIRGPVASPFLEACEKFKTSDPNPGPLNLS